MVDAREELVFTPLGGAGEIGMNLALYGFGRLGEQKWIMVDLGIGFADSTMPGIDRVLPDTRFIEERRGDLLAVILTHAHEDHCGAVIDLWSRLQVPVYATTFAISLLRAKMAGERVDLPIPFREIPLGGRFRVGDFDVESIPVPHSIPEANGLAIRTPLGMVFHSGDWKLDSAPQIGENLDISRLEALGREGCRALICDSTNAVHDGLSASEGEVLEGLRRVIVGAKGLVAVTAFASNVARLRSVALVAAECGRRVMISGRAMKRIESAAREAGYLAGVPPFISDETFRSHPREELLVLITGSQGEDRAGLTRAAFSDHRQIRFVRGDKVIFSARTIPGNEEAVMRVENRLIDSGVELVTGEDELVHVSGHPRRGELLRMYGWLNPDCVVPVHGEPKHMESQAKLAEGANLRVVRVRNGDLLRLIPGPAEVVEAVASGRFYKDGDFLVSEQDRGVQERRRISRSGCIVVSLLVDREERELIGHDIVLLGVPYESYNHGKEDVHSLVEGCIDEVLDTFPERQLSDPERLSKTVRRSICSQVARIWGKWPLCRVMVSHC